MKKFVLVCMSLFLVLGLAGCQNSSKKPETVVDLKTLPESHSVEAIKARGELIIALPDYISSIYVAPGSTEYHGYNAEFMKLLASEIGVKPTFVKKGSIEETLGSVEKGDTDIAVSNFARTPERLERFSVSDNYLFMELTKDVIYVLSENSQKFDTQENLNTAKISVLSGASQTEKAKKNFPNATYLEFSTNDECWEALKSGKADVLIVPTNSLIASNEEFKKALDNKVVVTSSYNFENTNDGKGYLMMKGNSSLTGKVNELIKKCLDDGSYKKWNDMYIEEAKALGYLN